MHHESPRIDGEAVRMAAVARGDRLREEAVRRAREIAEVVMGAAAPSPETSRR